MEQILTAVRAYDGVLELAPGAGGPHPEISWGDHFFYYAPDGEVPLNRQPYATIVTKDYPDDASSRLDAPDRWRVNVHVGPELFAELLGYPPAAIADHPVDLAAADTFLPHPVYGAYAWVSVVTPGPATTPRLLAALHTAHLADRRRASRRAE